MRVRDLFNRYSEGDKINLETALAYHSKGLIGPSDAFKHAGLGALCLGALITVIYVGAALCPLNHLSFASSLKKLFTQNPALSAVGISALVTGTFCLPISKAIHFQAYNIELSDDEADEILAKAKLGFSLESPIRARK